MVLHVLLWNGLSFRDYFNYRAVISCCYKLHPYLLIWSIHFHINVVQMFVVILANVLKKNFKMEDRESNNESHPFTNFTNPAY